MAVACGGLDALAFTGGIGEHAGEVRDEIVARLAHLQPFETHVVAAREELVVAAEAERLLAASR
jgi:acetate kinase